MIPAEEKKPGKLYSFETIRMLGSSLCLDTLVQTRPSQTLPLNIVWLKSFHEVFIPSLGQLLVPLKDSNAYSCRHDKFSSLVIWISYQWSNSGATTIALCLVSIFAVSILLGWTFGVGLEISIIAQNSQSVLNAGLSCVSITRLRDWTFNCSDRLSRQLT